MVIAFFIIWSCDIAQESGYSGSHQGDSDMASDEDETRLTKSSRERRRRLRRERQQAEKARGRDTRSDDDDSVSCSAGTGTGTNMESHEKLKNKLRYLILNDIGSISISRTKIVYFVYCDFTNL